MFFVKLEFPLNDSQVGLIGAGSVLDWLLFLLFFHSFSQTFIKCLLHALTLDETCFLKITLE